MKTNLISVALAAAFTLAAASAQAQMGAGAGAGASAGANTSASGSRAGQQGSSQGSAGVGLGVGVGAGVQGSSTGVLGTNPSGSLSTGAEMNVDAAARAEAIRKRQEELRGKNAARSNTSVGVSSSTSSNTEGNVRR